MTTPPPGPVIDPAHPVEPVEPGEWVYRHRDADGALLYVGRSRHPAHRWRHGHADKPWRDQVTAIELEGPFPTVVEAAERERAIYDTEAPAHNQVRPGIPRGGGRGRGSAARGTQRGEVEAVSAPDRRRAELVAAARARAFAPGARPYGEDGRRIWSRFDDDGRRPGRRRRSRLPGRSGPRLLQPGRRKLGQ